MIQSYEHPLASGAYGHLYFMGKASDDQNPYLFSMNPTGGIRWRTPLDFGLGSSRSIAVDGDENIYLTFDTGIYVFNGDGQPLWSSSWEPYTSPRSCLSMDGTLYVARGTQLLAFRD